MLIFFPVELHKSLLGQEETLYHLVKSVKEDGLGKNCRRRRGETEGKLYQEAFKLIQLKISICWRIEITCDDANVGSQKLKQIEIYLSHKKVRVRWLCWCFFSTSVIPKPV